MRRKKSEMEWAIKIEFVLFFILGMLIYHLIPKIAHGEVLQKFNPIEGRWETTYQDSEIRIAPDGRSQYVMPRHQERDRSEDRQDLRESARIPDPSFNFDSGRWEFPK